VWCQVWYSIGAYAPSVYQPESPSHVPQEAAEAAGTPLAHVPHSFVRLSGDLEADLATGVSVVAGWLPGANACVRSAQPLSGLSVAQQCGGSDAFSGVSGNPAAGEACLLLARHGGKAVLAETDELMGSESYILRRVKDVQT
jgi:altronate dehydratase